MDAPEPASYNPVMRFLAIGVLFLLSGCAGSTIVPFHGPTNAPEFPPVDPTSVGVYRSTNPYPSFVELGAITYNTESYDLAGMYRQIRKDAAAYGAQAVVDMKLTKETHSGLVSQQVCTPVTTCGTQGCTTESACHMEQVPTEVTTYLITGSMIREKK